MIKIVGCFVLILSLPSHALVPVEGLLLGKAQENLQHDPLKTIFGNIYDQTQTGEKIKIKKYYNTYEKGTFLKESCSYLSSSKYSTIWAQKQAIRSVVSTLQYIGLDTSIKAVGAYAKKLELSTDDFSRLSKNLVNNYCSKNVTVISLKNLEKSLWYYYENPDMNYVPSINSSPFATSLVKAASDKPKARSSEFDLVLKNFRAFCSWGGDIDDLRLLTPYLSNSFIMAFVIKNMVGIQDVVNEKTMKVEEVLSEATTQVTCEDLICRNVSQKDFRKKFPLSAGSTGLRTDLSKLYCHHFRFLDLPHKTLPEIQKWMKEADPEDIVLETSHFIALMTGVPDFFNGALSYRDVALFAKSSLDERWSKWAMDRLEITSKDLLYEDALKIRVIPLTQSQITLDGFEIGFSVAMGEIDNLLSDNDRIDLEFNLKLSKNYLHSIRTKWRNLEKSVNLAGQDEFRSEIARYLDLQLREKEKYFKQKMWNETFSLLIADELIRQTNLYRGSLFNTYQDEVLKIPVRFSYGLFALSYLRYRLSKVNPPLPTL